MNMLGKSLRGNSDSPNVMSGTAPDGSCTQLSTTGGTRVTTTLEARLLSAAQAWRDAFHTQPTGGRRPTSCSFEAAGWVEDPDPDGHPTRQPRCAIGQFERQVVWVTLSVVVSVLLLSWLFQYAG